VIRRIHDAYVGVVFNPFYIAGEIDKITSLKFDREIERIGREWKATM
jgi:Sedlin, N-terminal conserved region